MSKITVTELELQVKEQEDVILNVTLLAGFSKRKLPTEVNNYVEKYPKRLSDDKPLSFLVKRVASLLPGIPFYLVSSSGIVIRNTRVKIGKVRDCYQVRAGNVV